MCIRDRNYYVPNNIIVGYDNTESGEYVEIAQMALNYIDWHYTNACLLYTSTENLSPRLPVTHTRRTRSFCSPSVSTGNSRAASLSLIHILFLLRQDFPFLLNFLDLQNDP